MEETIEHHGKFKCLSCKKQFSVTSENPNDLKQAKKHCFYCNSNKIVSRN